MTKKRKRAARARHSYEVENEVDEMSEDDEVEQHSDTPVIDRAGPALDVSGWGTSAMRGDVDKSTPVNADMIIGRLPARAAVVGGGVWVSQAFDAGAVLEIGNEDDFNTYASVPLDVVGFAPLVLNPEGVPRPDPIEVRGKIEASGALTTGHATFVLIYA